MASSQTLNFVLFFCCSIFLLAPSASSSFISREALATHSSRGRSLLQNFIPCPVDFEKEDYSTMTSQCKGPVYDQKLCCNAFKSLGCPYTDELNDLETDCAFALFDTINFHGHYPLGLFADLCIENEKGLNCQGYQTSHVEKKVKSQGKVYNNKKQ